jgi:hypothetical protein
MGSSPIGQDVSLEAEFVLQPAVLGQGILESPNESQVNQPPCCYRLLVFQCGALPGKHNCC